MNVSDDTINECFVLWKLGLDNEFELTHKSAFMAGYKICKEECRLKHHADVGEKSSTHEN